MSVYKAKMTEIEAKLDGRDLWCFQTTIRDIKEDAKKAGIEERELEKFLLMKLAEMFRG